MARTAVRRVNEWDGPSMLKVYTPYTGTPATPEREAPDLQAYVRRIDRYTYGLGWLLCEIDHQTVGFCHLSEDPAAPEDLFTVEFQLYVKQGMCRRHIGTALWELMRDMLEMGNRRRVVCRVHRENQAALAFFRAMGFVPLEEKLPEEPEKLWLAYHLRPWDPAAPKPTKPYLVEAADYEAAREKAAALVDVSGLE
ncbi:MAG TPA: GNAT family N-acetyltransferase [Candidatus Acutalibacter ornithocaccae]|uniref:GNAT family N-acetyltransferase n=1 Tax=Candidatus Acutalibacter ornithocaccae TaxID=2838416 RepID=A0A9D2LXW4_9FIRM|nr:GNAT family N-acetyltransferase [Candidatus Acutalibacter ornithocaccae]